MKNKKSHYAEQVFKGFFSCLVYGKFLKSFTVIIVAGGDE